CMQGLEFPLYNF
nr:immunoglobulin light chain junction region [Macaca mulatta]